MQKYAKYYCVTAAAKCRNTLSIISVTAAAKCRNTLSIIVLLLQLNAEIR